MSALSLNFDNSIFDYTYNHGISDDAKIIAGYLSDVKSKIKQENISIGKSFTDVQDELQEVLGEAKEENWDAYGAKSANLKSYLEAQRFINSYPMSMPLPEVAIDPDGEFSFEWYKNREFTFSVSFSPDNELTYAGIFGLNKTNGIEYFGDEIPETILENIKRVYS